MSVTFWVRELEPVPDGEEINMANGNARRVMEHLGLGDELCGSIPGPELAVKCRRKLLRIVGSPLDPAIPDEVFKTPGRATMVFCGVPEGYLHERTEQLLKLAEQAGDRVVVWG